MRMKVIALILCGAAIVAVDGFAEAQDKGTLDPKPLPPLADPADPKVAADAGLRPCDDPYRGADALDRLLFSRLPGRREGASGRWRHGAFAAFAQSDFGAILR